MKLNEATKETEPAPIISRAKFANQIGRTPLTLWRWERIGWIDPAFNIAGKPFYTRAAIEKFSRRSAAGEFAKAPHAPCRQKSEVAA